MELFGYKFFERADKPMQVDEALSTALIKGPDELRNPSNITRDQRTDNHLSDKNDMSAFSFSNLNGDAGYYGSTDAESIVRYTSNMIDGYRKLANDPEISNAVDIITDEIAFTVDERELKLEVDVEGSEALKKKLSEAFDRTLKVMNMTENINPISRQMYVDGQLNCALTFEEGASKDLAKDNIVMNSAIKEAKIITPNFLYYDKNSELWKYHDIDSEDHLYNFDDEKYDETYTRDELVHVDYKLYEKIKMGDRHYKLNLSYLENAKKTLNKLNTLEDMLVPMRYSRSVTRRMFNIDVADLPPAKATQLMSKIKSDFKYKKEFDTETGKIRNQVSTHPMVEDYFLGNRSGTRGTTVEMMDEKGGLMDLEDIKLTGKKLYASLKIPSNRNPYADEEGGNFGYSADNEITNEEKSFNLFIDRLRVPICNLVKKVLKREVIYSGTMREDEWDEYEDKIHIKFTSASIFMENLKKDLFLRQISNFVEIKEEIGKTISLETAVSKTMDITSVELMDEFEKIDKEKKNPLFRNFYSSNEDDF